MKLDNFEKLIAFLTLDLNYSPNETDLNLASLNLLAAELRKANGDIYELIAIMELKRIERNFGLYELGIGIIDLSLACKKYVRSLYGTTSPLTRMVTSVYLRRFMRMER